MYSDDQIAPPRDVAHFWQMVEDNYEFARHVLEDYGLESREDALETGARPAMRSIAYRNVSVEYDQRDHYYEMGKTLLPTVRHLIDKREISPAFLHEWGKLMFCHGFIASHVFDDSDDLASARGAFAAAATKSAETRLVKQWLAHVFALPRFSQVKRETADFEVAQFLVELRDDPIRSREYPEWWFRRLLDEESDELRSTFIGKNFGWKEMRPLARLPTDDLPPIPIS